MLTDENDCSMRDDSYSWVPMTASGGFRMWRGSSVCPSNPNDPCCYSCMLDQLASADCKARDATCRQGDPAAKLAPADDDVNVRCRSMKRRFGFDFLFPPSRYVNALTKTKLCPKQDYGDLDCDCTLAKAKGISCNPGAPMDNPLYVNLNPGAIPTGPSRTGPDTVFLAGVIGVPWQDLATDPSDGATLEYRTASQLNWDLFSPKANADYSLAQLADPLMIESFAPRSGTQPITGEALAPPEAPYLANKINGHEWYTSNKDVQYACIFSLNVQLTSGVTNATRVCDLQTACGTDDGSDTYRICARRFDGCTCAYGTTVAGATNPLDPTVNLTPVCQNAQGAYTNTQTFAKAYPGLRELQVLRGFHEATGSDNAIVGSICPKDLNYAHIDSAGYGYNPAVKALVDRLKDKLSGTCLPRQLTVDPTTGTVPCDVVEAISSNDKTWCNCQANGRTTVSSELSSAIFGSLVSDSVCGAPPLPDCSGICLCQLNELLPGTTSGDLCLNQLNVDKTTPDPGFCYVDPSQGVGSADVVAACPGTDKRIIRIVGNGSASTYHGAPAPGKVLIACSGATFNPDSNTGPAKSQN
jgi:hypothetical protein